MLTKFDPAGEVIWSTFYGGLYAETFSLGIDGDNNIYLAGRTNSPVGIATAGAFQTSLSTGENGENYVNGFMAKFNSDGQLQWGTYYPSQIRAFAVDVSGNIYISGKTPMPNGISTPGTFQSDYLYSNDGEDLNRNGFLSKFDTLGNRVWGTYYGLSDIRGISVDEFGGIYIAGVADSSSSPSGFYATPNCYQALETASFLSKFDATGNREWSTYYGSPNTLINIYDLQVNRNEIYFGGITNSDTLIASPGAHQTTLAGGFDVFLAKFDVSGQRLWATYYGGEASDFDLQFPYSGKMIAFLGKDVYLTFATKSTTGMATAGAFKENYDGTGYQDNFIAKFTPQGQRLWGTYYGGAKTESASGVIPISQNSFYTYGSTSSIDNIGTANTQQPNLESTGSSPYGIYNAYLARFDESLSVGGVDAPQISLYPNPSQGKFTLNHILGAKLALYDLQGRLLKKIKTKANKNTVQVDVQGLPAGVYFMVINKQNAQTKTIKVVLQ